MHLSSSQIESHNRQHLAAHRSCWQPLQERLESRGLSTEQLLEDLQAFQVAIPSWALGTGATRFGRFPMGGAPRSLTEKMEDVGVLHALNRSSGSISLHIPWDIPEDVEALRQQAAVLQLRFDAVNSNTFQDQPGQKLSYRFGSLCHPLESVRKQAIEHNLEVIRCGRQLGSRALSVWLSDGSNFPGQMNLREALRRTEDSLRQIYAAMPEDWEMYLEYKPFEPNFYATVIPDWGTSMLLAIRLGNRAKTLVDLGHHLPNTNIEQIVATLLAEGRLAGFHFNDSKYADDDLTAGSIKPYQLFLIFYELLDGMRQQGRSMSELGWMIDASHTIKDPLEDLLQSVEAIQLAYAQALVVNSTMLREAQASMDPVQAQECLQDAFRSDLRALLQEARLRKGAALHPLACYRELGIRRQLIDQRGAKTIASGL